MSVWKGDACWFMAEKHWSDYIWIFRITFRSSMKDKPNIWHRSVWDVLKEYPMIVAFAAGNNYTYIDSMTAFVEGECSNIEYYSVFFFNCRFCAEQWKGSSLVLGTMYAYDIFAAMPCCPDRLTVSIFCLLSSICRKLQDFHYYEFHGN